MLQKQLIYNFMLIMFLSHFPTMLRQKLLQEYSDTVNLYSLYHFCSGGGQHRFAIPVMCPPISRTCDTSLESFLCSFLVHMIIIGFTEVGFSAIRRGIRDLLILATTKIWQKYSKKASVVFCFVVSLLRSHY